MLPHRQLKKNSFIQASNNPRHMYLWALQSRASTEWHLIRQCLLSNFWLPTLAYHFQIGSLCSLAPQAAQLWWVSSAISVKHHSQMELHNPKVHNQKLWLWCHHIYCIDMVSIWWWGPRCRAMEKHFLCLVDVFLSVDVIVIQTFHIKYLYI